MGATCAVAMFAVIGYSVGRSAGQPRKPLRAKPLQPRLGSVVMAEAAEAKAKAKAAPKAKAKAKAAPKAEAEEPAEAPAEVAAAVVDKSLYKRGDVNKMIGTSQWSINGSSKVFDPLNLASKYDINWLREAE